MYNPSDYATIALILATGALAFDYFGSASDIKDTLDKTKDILPNSEKNKLEDQLFRKGFVLLH